VPDPTIDTLRQADPANGLIHYLELLRLLRQADLPSDPPTDPADFVSPDPLVFAYTPVEDPAVYADVWSEFIAHLAAVTGREVEFFAVQDNAPQLEAMRAGRLHVTGFNTGSVPRAVNLAGFVPFCMMAAEDDSFGYEMEIIVPADSPLRSPSDLAGRTIAFTSPTSNSGFKAPSAILQREFGLTGPALEGDDYEATFSGDHGNSIIGIANGDYAAAAVANSVLSRMIARGVVDPAAFRSIYTSPTFPTTAYGYAHDLDPDLAAKVVDAFYSFDWEGTNLYEEFAAMDPPNVKFIPITYEQHWAIVREIDAALGVKYAEP